METIPKDECVKIGFFRKTHGVFGELVLEYETQFEFSIENSDHFFIELEGLLVPFFVIEDGFRFKTENTAIISLDGVKTEKYAKRMVGASVYLLENEIIKTHEFSDDELIGFLLSDEVFGEIGNVEFVDNYSGNIVLTVNSNGKEILVPYNEELLINIDKQKRTLKLRLPGGLFDE